MKLQYLCGYLTAQFCGCGPEVYYYNNTGELKEINVCVKTMIKLGNMSHSGSNSSVDGRALVIPGVQRRHRQSRHDALEIFETSSLSEDLWDSELMAKIIRWLMELDEVGLTDKDLFPWTRLIISPVSRVIGQIGRRGYLHLSLTLPLRTAWRCDKRSLHTRMVCRSGYEWQIIHLKRKLTRIEIDFDYESRLARRYMYYTVILRALAAALASLVFSRGRMIDKLRGRFI
ncbi:hypothetical protein B0O99DRAFT_171833 [Bisporella sp. PMI_857]|nr:hypothetical protein B0O99DRAFT_171833 [Bisporella sp. PMI_857]